jgi:hypothetical protein
VTLGAGTWREVRRVTRGTSGTGAYLSPTSTLDVGRGHVAD